MIMPELPEVQTVVNDLNEKIKGDVITEFWSEWPKAIKGKTLAVFKKEIEGRKILEARRIGKNIFIDLSEKKTLYIHLKMTGHLLIKEKGKNSEFFEDKVNQYVRHKFFLGKNKVVEFSDLRKFAKIMLVDTDKISELPEIKALGVDAMSSNFTFQKFNEILEKKKKSPIGITLMDQHLIAGIGNIYRSEILFLAGILPTRKNENISMEKRKEIYKFTLKVLKKAIKLRGTSDSDYRDTTGAPGGFQKILNVYNRASEKCKKCDTMITRAVLGQRSIFFCPKCQK
jgi:formamidopyrimidine-DNA glycosylase